MPLKDKCSEKSVNITSRLTKLDESNPSNTISVTPELEQQFEVELCWCIQQLKTALKTGKLNNKQVQDHTKALNILLSNSTPLVQKRQVMRLSFGNYRAKMAAEEKKCSKNVINMKIMSAVPSKKSLFVKKSKFVTSSGSKALLNFCSPNSDELNNKIKYVKIELDESSCQNKKNFTFVFSDNNFRFGFDKGKL